MVVKSEKEVVTIDEVIYLNGYARTLLYCWSDSVTALLSNDKRLVSGERGEDPPTMSLHQLTVPHKDGPA